MKKEGVKWDNGKVMLSLIPAGTLTRIGKVMSNVITRTDPPPYIINSWTSVYPRTRYLDAVMRHLDHILAGVEKDPDSGLPPIDHLLTDAAFLSKFVADGEKIIHPEYVHTVKVPVYNTEGKEVEIKVQVGELTPSA